MVRAVSGLRCGADGGGGAVQMDDAGLHHGVHAFHPDQACEGVAGDGDAVGGMLPVCDAQAEPAGVGDDDPAALHAAPDHHRGVCMGLPHGFAERQAHRRDLHACACCGGAELREGIAFGLYGVVDGQTCMLG